MNKNDIVELFIEDIGVDDLRFPYFLYFWLQINTIYNILIIVY